MQAGLLISGINAEVMPGQWEFQIGPVGAPDVGDEVMIARWLLHRLGEQFGIVCTFHPKPVKGDWNGTPLSAAPMFSKAEYRWGWPRLHSTTSIASELTSRTLIAPLQRPGKDTPCAVLWDASCVSAM